MGVPVASTTFFPPVFAWTILDFIKSCIDRCDESLSRPFTLSILVTNWPRLYAWASSIIRASMPRSSKYMFSSLRVFASFSSRSFRRSIFFSICFRVFLSLLFVLPNNSSYSAICSEINRVSVSGETDTPLKNPCGVIMASQSPLAICASSRRRFCAFR